MSFVQQLRMRNMFPINSDIGSARVEPSGYEDIPAVNVQRLRQSTQPSGIQQIAQPVQQQPLRFGGVLEQSNPGADILRRATRNAENLWESYKQPLNQPVSGPSNDEINMEQYFKRKNEETKANALQTTAEANLANAGNKGWKTVNVTDPQNPGQTTAVQVNDMTGQVRPVDVNGVISSRPSPQALEKMNVERQARSENEQNVRTKAQDSLDLLSKLLDDKDQLTSEAQWATGGTSWMGKIPLPTPAYAGASNLDRLAKTQVLSLIEDMKKASASGSVGMGNMSNSDRAVLENASSTLGRPGQDEETIRKELVRVREVLKRNLNYGSSSMAPATSHNTAGNTNMGATGATTPPQAPDGFEYVRRPDNKGWTAVRKGSGGR